MIKLSGSALFCNAAWDHRRILRVTKNKDLPLAKRAGSAFVVDEANPPSGYGACLSFAEYNGTNLPDLFHLPADVSYLDEGDVIRLYPSGQFNVLFRATSRDNTVLLTYQCNHYCLMCSQPPRNQDDSWLLGDAFRLLEMIPKETGNIGFSGGEPTLYGDGFIKLISKAKQELPETTVDVLTNGRAFRDGSFAGKIASIAHPHLVFGVPIYSDDPLRHDYIVQSNGAFGETISGIINLKRLKQNVEIRLVLHKLSIERLLQTCEYICRNLLFVDHVALMGLEMIGFTRANLDELWADPYDYKDILSDAVRMLTAYGINTSVYNHQLCLVNDDVYGSYKRSISDWKTEYVEECDACVRRADCGGFFFSSKLYRYSNNIKAFR